MNKQLSLTIAALIGALLMYLVIQLGIGLLYMVFNYPLYVALFTGGLTLGMFISEAINKLK